MSTTGDNDATVCSTVRDTCHSHNLENRMRWRQRLFQLSWLVTVASSLEYYEAEGSVWTNWLRSLTVGGPFRGIYYPTNAVAGKWQYQDWKGGLKGLLDTLRLSKGCRVRAFGSRWASSNIAYTNDTLVDTTGLTFGRIGLWKKQVTKKYQERRKQLVLVQAGVMIRDLNRALIRRGLALSTSGAGDGQRIAGAISTGTHGSSFVFGSMQDYVKAIHMVVDEDRHVLIQRKSDRVITPRFAQYMNGAELIEDDDMFNAALVSFGSFGIIHAVILEAEPLYQLKMQSLQVTYDSAKQAMQSLNTSSLGFKEEIDPEKLVHFEMTVNPFQMRTGRGAFVRVFEKIPILPNETAHVIANTLDVSKLERYDFFEELGLSFGGMTVPLRFFKRLVYGEAMMIPLVRFFQTTEPQPIVKLPSHFFTGKGMDGSETRTAVSGVSMEVGVPLQVLPQVMDIAANVLHHHPIPTPLAIRYVKQSQATLAFTKFDKITAVIEFPGAQSDTIFTNTVQVFDKVATELANQGIEHTFHWGQHFPVNDEWVRASYGKRLNDWQRQRRILLGDEGIEMFSSETLTSLGI